MSIALHIYSAHQCIVEADTPERRSEAIADAQTRVNLHLFESVRNLALSHAAAAALFAALGYAAGYAAAYLLR